MADGVKVWPTEYIGERRPTSSTAPGLLALYPGLRQTGWAVIREGERAGQFGARVVDCGVADLGIARKLDPSARITGHLKVLDAVYSRWRPDALVCSRSGGFSRRVTGLQWFFEALQDWADGNGLPITTYAAAEVRAAVAGKPNASREALAYAVMQHFRLIGENLTAVEWESMAVGCHHLQRTPEEQEHPCSGC